MKQLREYIQDIQLERMHDASLPNDKFSNLTSTGKELEPTDSASGLMVEPNPYMQSWGGKYAIGNTEPGAGGWAYVPNDQPPSGELGSIDSSGKKTPALDWGSVPPALDLSKKTIQQPRFPHTPTPTDEPAKTGSAGWRDIYQLNQQTIGSDPSKIKPGQLLKMPNGRPDYLVQPGDTLATIAARDQQTTLPRFPHTPTTTNEPQKKATVTAPHTPTPPDAPFKPFVADPHSHNIQPKIKPDTGLNLPAPNTLGVQQPGVGPTQRVYDRDDAGNRVLNRGREELITPAILQAEKRAAADKAAYEKKQRDRAKNESSELDRILTIARHTR